MNETPVGRITFTYSEDEAVKLYFTYHTFHISSDSEFLQRF